MSTKKFLLFFFIVMLLAIYNVPIGPLNFSLDRLLLPFALVAVLINKRLPVPGLGPILFWIVLASILSITFADDYQFSGFMKFAPSWFQSLLVFYLAVATSNKFGVEFLSKVLKLHLYILLPLTLYGFWYVYILDTYHFSYPLKFLLNDFSADEHKVNMLRYKRLFFPLSSAPRLGFVAGSLFIFFYYFTPSKLSKWVLCSTSFFILVVTISRGPMVSLVLAFMLAYLIKGVIKRKMVNQVVFYTFTVFLIGFAALFLHSTVGEDSIFARFFILGSDEDASFKAHFNVRLRVLNEVLNGSLPNLLFGYGLGQFSTLLQTTSAHSSYFTQLYEQGVFGVLAYVMVFVTTVRASGNLYLRYPNKITMGLFVMALFLGIIHLTYDAITTTILWAYTGFVFGLSIYLKRYYET